jgi:hypothetical protein
MLTHRLKLNLDVLLEFPPTRHDEPNPAVKSEGKRGASRGRSGKDHQLLKRTQFAKKIAIENRGTGGK